MGVTPLHLPEALPTGRYRVWTSLAPAESATRWVRVEQDSAPSHFDLAFEGVLWPAGPGVRPARGLVIDAGFIEKVAALLGVSEVVLVGVGVHEVAPWLYVVACTAGRRSAPRVSLTALVEDIDWERLVGGLLSSPGEPAPSSSSSPGLASIVPMPLLPLLLDEAERPRPLLWAPQQNTAVLWGALSVGAVLVVGAAATTGTALWLYDPSAPSTGEGTFRVTVTR